MFVSLIGQFVESLQFLIIFISLVFLWFRRCESPHMQRSVLIITVASIILAHVLVHALDQLWFHALPARSMLGSNILSQGWEAFYLQWYSTPSSIAVWFAFAIGMFRLSRITGLLLCTLALFEAWLHILLGIAYPSDILYAVMIGGASAWVLHSLERHLWRTTEGIQQICYHMPEVIYPMMLLIMIDMNNDLQFMTNSYYFMFGWPTH